jgi:hypothetical protein
MKNSDKIPEGNPFKVPENYFEELNDRIISSTIENQYGNKKQRLYFRLRSFLAIAASVAVMAILSYTGIKLFTPRNDSISLSGIPVEVYSGTLLNEIDLLTLEENADLTGMQGLGPNIDKKDIIDYLLLENIDINEIQEQL